MPYSFPTDVKQIIDAHLASGRYATEDDVLRDALRALAKQPKNGREQVQSPTLDEVYAVLGQRFESGETDTAQRHNEHQP